MNASFYIASSGIEAQQMKIDTIANNISNLSSNGYRTKNTTFSDLLYSSIYTPAGGQGEDLMSGSGVRVEKTDVTYETGAIKFSKQPLDYAIKGEGFFALQNPVTGQTTYTRNGNFTVKQFDDQKFYLTSSHGEYVLDTKGQKIEVDLTHKEVDPYEDEFVDDTIPVAKNKDPYDLTSVYDIGIYDFKSKEGMICLDNEAFIPVAKNGPAFLQTESGLERGALEVSNVEVGYEFAKLIESQKAFQYALKMVQVSDEVEEISNSLR